MIERVHLPYQVKAQGEAGIALIGLGLELHLVSPIQLLHAMISWRRTVTNVKEGLLIVLEGMML